MEAWVTLATNDSYALGALTLAQSLKRVQTSKSLVVMITSQVSGAIAVLIEQPGSFHTYVQLQHPCHTRLKSEIITNATTRRK